MRILLALLILPACLWGESPATQQVKLGAHTFTLPANMTIEKVAGEPLVARPVAMDFDEQGALYVSESSGSNEPPSMQLEKKPHRILKLVDRDGDGRFDQVTVFADKMMLPQGVMWSEGSLYVGAPPHIWKLTDTNGDGVADQRVLWFDGKTLTGCMNDLHGPYRGVDGKIYWTKGAFARQTYQLPKGREWTTRASHIFRANPDGTGIEPVMTGGMDNPVDVAFLPTGDLFFTTTFFQHPGGGQRDGLIHAIYGGIYGKDHDVIRDPSHRWTQPQLTPVMTHLGPAAPCGLHCYESQAWGKDYNRNLFACQFNLRKVSRHQLVTQGASYQTIDHDFLVSDNSDFHPTDVIEDADGSLLVIDTGGWYKLCCPSSQLVKGDVFGAIYRIRRNDAPPIADPRGLKLSWEKLSIDDLLRRLDDTRPAVRRRAIEMLARQSVTESQWSNYLAKANSAAKISVLHVLARRPASERFASILDRLMADVDPDVVQTCLHIRGLNPEQKVDLQAIFQRGTPHQQRKALELLGRQSHPATEDTWKGIGDLSVAGDFALQHALTQAFIDRDSWSNSANCRASALVARSYSSRGNLKFEEVLAFAQQDAERAYWIIGRKPEWSQEVRQVVRTSLLDRSSSREQTRQMLELMARFGKSAEFHGLITELLEPGKLPPERFTALLDVMGRLGLKEMTGPWSEVLAKHLTNDTVDPAILNLLKALPSRSPVIRQALVKRLSRETHSEIKLRLTDLVQDAGALDSERFAYLKGLVHPERSPFERGTAADILARARLTSDQQLALLETIKPASPLERDRLLNCFSNVSDQRVLARLLETLKDPALSRSLRVDDVKVRLAKLPKDLESEAEALYRLIDAERGQQQARLDDMLRKLPKGDIRRGQTVFNSQKASCIACHMIGYVGGKIGPDLTRIGGIRSERDLLEAVVFPSASFVRSYEPLSVTTRDGKVYNGIAKKDAPDEIILVLAADKEVRLARDEIEDVQPGKVSIMPAGLEQQLTPQDLADLIAFLKTCR